MEIHGIYLDNFRGFSNAFLQLKDVNFFVGENSTGKTSVMSIIMLFSDMRSFWSNPSQRMSSNDIDLGNFDDIVSKNAADKSYFRIGLFGITKTKETEKCQGSLMTFVKKEGMPKLVRYTFLNEKREIDISFSEKRVKYEFTDQAGINECTLSSIQETIDKWVTKHHNSTTGYTYLPDYYVSAPLPVLTSTVNKFIDKKSTELSVPSFSDWITIFGISPKWIAPIRTKPQKTYDTYEENYSPEGAHAPYLLKKLLRKKKTKKQFSDYIQLIGKSSGLFDGVDIKNYSRGVTSPFELDIKLGTNYFRITDVGYGVSQVLPILVELFEGGRGQNFLIQQPEIHLHPKAQAALGEVFELMASAMNQKFIIETHSDYLIDRFRTTQKRAQNREPINSQVVYFERSGEGNKFYTIEISPSGEIASEQPEGYRDFFIKEEMKVLGL